MDLTTDRRTLHMTKSSFRTITAAFLGAVLSATMVANVALAWDGSTEGQPDQLDAGATGYFIWHNDNGWHLRAHNNPSGATYSGHIHSDGIFRNVELVRAESTEHLSVGDGGHTINFRFRTFDHIDGLNFSVDGGSNLRFDLETDGHQTLLRHIFLGSSGRHPLSNPFTLER
jgi:hypothetical protein